MNRNVNLRTITTSGSLDSFTTTYEGEYKKQIISAALLSGDTLDKGGVTIKPNVQYKEVIKKIDSGDILTSATCDFSATADVIDIAERVLEVVQQQVNLEVCTLDFSSDYLALEQGFSAYKNLPTSFADFIMAHVVAKVAEKTEQNIWGGVSGSDGYDGLTTLMTADSSVNDVTTSETAFAASTIIDELGKLVDTIPSAVYGKDDLKLYLPTVAYKAYVRALGGFGAVNAICIQKLATDNNIGELYAKLSIINMIGSSIGLAVGVAITMFVPDHTTRLCLTPVLAAGRIYSLNRAVRTVLI